MLRLLDDYASLVVPPPSKRQRTDAANRAREQQDVDEIPANAGTLRLHFFDETTGLPVGQGSRDKTMKVWNAKDGSLAHSLNSHAHWINHLALSTAFVICTAYHDHTGHIPAAEEAKVAKAKERFLKAAMIQGGT